MLKYRSLIKTLPNLGINYQPGLGYSPAGGPPVGGWSGTPGPGFYGKQPIGSLLPRLSGPGSTPSTKNAHFFGYRRRRSNRKFGAYPLMNQPSSEIDFQMFPLPPAGNGQTPGGVGGPFLQGGDVNFNTYWGFGPKKKRKSRKKISPRAIWKLPNGTKVKKTGRMKRISSKMKRLS